MLSQQGIMSEEVVKPIKKGEVSQLNGFQVEFNYFQSIDKIVQKWDYLQEIGYFNFIDMQFAKLKQTNDEIKASANNLSIVLDNINKSMDKIKTYQMITNVLWVVTAILGCLLISCIGGVAVYGTLNYYRIL